MFSEEEEVKISEPLLKKLRDARRATVLTGAGVSAESGIPTFRGAGGIWEKYDFQKLATPWGFKEDPALVWEWYQLRQVEIRKAVPNPAHIVIASMAKYYPAFRLLTQNIDGMHQRAGSEDVVELHGNIWRIKCERDGTRITLDSPVDEIPPLCQCGSVMRPDVVWFGEPLSAEILSEASQAASESDLMFVVGTSAIVYPAAALPVIVKNSGGTVVEVNMEETEVSRYADASFFGRAGELLPAIWRNILSAKGL